MNDIERRLTTMLRDRAEDFGSSADAWGRIDARTRRMDRRRRLIPLAVAAAVLALAIVIVSLVPRTEVELVPVNPGGDLDLSVFDQPPVPVTELPQRVRDAARGAPGDAEPFFDEHEVRLAHRSGEAEAYVVPREDGVCVLGMIRDTFASSSTYCRSPEELAERGALVVPVGMTATLRESLPVGLVPDGYTTATYLNPSSPEDDPPAADVVNNTFIFASSLPDPAESWIELTGPAGTRLVPALSYRQYREEDGLAIRGQPPVPVENLPQAMLDAAHGPDNGEAFFDEREVRLAQRSGDTEVYVTLLEDGVCLMSVIGSAAGSRCADTEEFWRLGFMVMHLAVTGTPPLAVGLVPDGYTTATLIDTSLPEDDRPAVQVVNNTFLLPSDLPVPGETWIELEGPEGARRIPGVLGSPRN